MMALQYRASTLPIFAKLPDPGSRRDGEREGREKIQTRLEEGHGSLKPGSNRLQPRRSYGAMKIIESISIFTKPLSSIRAEGS